MPSSSALATLFRARPFSKRADKDLLLCGFGYDTYSIHVTEEDVPGLNPHALHFDGNPVIQNFAARPLAPVRRRSPGKTPENPDARTPRALSLE